MDLLKKELERKRKAIELAKKSGEVNVKNSQEGGGKKRSYLKASELRKIQERHEDEEREMKKRHQRDTNRMVRSGTAKIQSNRSSFIDGTSSTQNGSSSNKDGNEHSSVVDNKNINNDGKRDEKRRRVDQMTNHDHDDSNKGSSISQHGTKTDASKNNNNEKKGEEEVIVTMSSTEITNALRNLGIPVWLFGEKDDGQRMQRLQEAQDSKKAAMAGMSEHDDFKLGSGHGIRNPFLGGKKNQDQDEQTMTMSKPTEDHKDDNDEDNDEDDPHKAIHRFFKSQLKQWEEDLVNRTDAEKRSLAGKNETKTLKQCKDYIRPLFKLCKNRRLEESLMGHLVKIIKYCKEGEFVKANDSYMDVAIGRAAWPIGVTMVGIHARSGRAKIESANVAHVMNSELQRKYLTSVKRLITYCQKKRTDVAPSKKVTNG